MPPALPALSVKIGTESFTARLRRDLAPCSCECLLALLPYAGKVIHARWSGEALWSPLAGAVPPGLVLPAENARHRPEPGEVLFFAGATSEPELLIVYGESRFACKAGPLEGNPVLTLDARPERIAGLGRDVLWNGAKPLRIEMET